MSDRPDNRTRSTFLYRAMQSLHKKGVAIDPVTLCAHLEMAGVLKDVGKPFVFGLGSGVPRSANVQHYAGIVRDKAMLRALRDHGRRLVFEVEEQAKTGAELLQQAEADIYRIGQSEHQSEWQSAEKLAGDLFPVIEQLNNPAAALTRIKTGFTELDQLTRGLQNGDLVIVGARPSMGKTAFAVQVALQAAKSATAAIISLEMSAEALALRSAITLGNVNGWRLMSGFASEGELQNVSDGVLSLGARKLYVDDAAYLNPMQARSKLRRLQNQAGRLGLVVIDYLQLMAPMPDDRRANRSEQVAGISRALKLMAREFNVPFLVLSQLSRGFEKGSNPRPSMSDLRESGALEQDADVVFLLHRPEVYDEKPANKGLAEVIIGKQRNGPTATVALQWHKDPMRFAAAATSTEKAGKSRDRKAS